MAEELLRDAGPQDLLREAVHAAFVARVTLLFSQYGLAGHAGDDAFTKGLRVALAHYLKATQIAARLAREGFGD